ncbi:MAG: AmmeMemoRadiSam system protein B [Candidatus Latescibacteria bacterium]|nr:AmmeMemoRadiSam system protein B [Candidatus Latescibacterota bacterium]
MISAAVRPSALAGSWYPGSPQALRKLAAGLLAGAEPERLPAGRPVVLMVPHAGYAYSGRVAGRGWGLLRDLVSGYRRIVILAPNHHAALSRISTPRWDAYATPLGEVALDRDACEHVAHNASFTRDTHAHVREHAEEIQLPLLQALTAAPPPIVPLLVPRLSRALRYVAAEALAPWCDGSTLFVISTDLTHYGSVFGYIPFRDSVPDRLRELDQGVLDAVLAWDAEALLEYGRRTGITMCGLEAAALVMSLPWPQRPRAAVIDYARSADRDGDYTLSVSYAAAVACLPPVVAA